MQNSYYNPNSYWGGFPDMNELYSMRSREKKNIRSLGNCVGGAVLLYLALQNIYSIILSIFGFGEIYLANELFRKGTEVLLIIFSILPSFMLFGVRMKKITGIDEPLALTKPERPLLTLLAFFAGMGSCMIANYVTAFFSAIMTVFGYELSSPDVGLPRGFAGITITVVQVVFVAALVEEIALRGYVMGNLRKYGSGFAIFISALIFALIHGNLIQAPFALIAGLALGYFSVRTGSIWTGIIIHAGNNLFSVALSYIGEFFGDNVLAAVYSVSTLFFLVSGLVCFIVFQLLTKKDKTAGQAEILTGGEKIKAFLSSPAVIVVIVIMIIITMGYVAPVEQAVS